MWKGSPHAATGDGRWSKPLVEILNVTIRSRGLDSGSLLCLALHAQVYHHPRQSFSKKPELAERVPGGDSGMFVSKDPQMSWKQKSCPLGFCKIAVSGKKFEEYCQYHTVHRSQTLVPL